MRQVGPARPAVAPLPNLFGVLETDFSTVYDISDTPPGAADPQQAVEQAVLAAEGR